MIWPCLSLCLLHHAGIYSVFFLLPKHALTTSFFSLCLCTFHPPLPFFGIPQTSYLLDQLFLNLQDSSQSHHLSETFLVNLSHPQTAVTLYCITNSMIILAFITLCNYYFSLFTYLFIFPTRVQTPGTKSFICLIKHISS